MTIADLNERSQRIFRHIVDLYVESGEPVGSRTLAKKMGISLSPATVRNVMSDLEDAGYLYSPHTSAGRLPTEMGLRFFVDGLLEVGEMAPQEMKRIEKQLKSKDKTAKNALEEAGKMLSGLSQCAGLVAAPKKDRPLRQIEFVNLGPGRVLAVLVSEDGNVENRVIELDASISASDLQQASNYLSDRLHGHTMAEARKRIKADMKERRSELNKLTQKVIEEGLAEPTNGDEGYLIVRGQANLLNDVKELEDLERIRHLFEALETRETMVKLLDETQTADGVQIYIGSENGLFDHSGCSMIVSPYQDNDKNVVGAIGVIGPTRLNYARVIPMVNYTAKLLSKMLN